jgi:predicted outer membrane repeat protein
VLELRWTGAAKWLTTITNSLFNFNTARTQGGAIYYDTYRPEMTNVVFASNSARYGKDIASYPIKIVDATTLSSNITLSDMVSGQTVSTDLRFKILDHDNQVTSVSNGGRISIVPVSSAALALGENSASIVSGIGCLTI